MPIEVHCMQCHARFRVDDRYAGRKGKCKNCGGPIEVPVPAPAAARRAPAPPMTVAAHDDPLAALGDMERNAPVDDAPIARVPAVSDDPWTRRAAAPARPRGNPFAALKGVRLPVGKLVKCALALIVILFLAGVGWWFFSDGIGGGTKLEITIDDNCVGSSFSLKTRVRTGIKKCLAVQKFSPDPNHPITLRASLAKVGSEAYWVKPAGKPETTMTVDIVKATLEVVDAQGKVLCTRSYTTNDRTVGFSIGGAAQFRGDANNPEKSYNQQVWQKASESFDTMTIPSVAALMGTNLPGPAFVQAPAPPAPPAPAPPASPGDMTPDQLKMRLMGRWTARTTDASGQGVSAELTLVGNNHYQMLARGRGTTFIGGEWRIDGDQLMLDKPGADGKPRQWVALGTIVSVSDRKLVLRTTRGEETYER